VTNPDQEPGAASPPPILPAEIQTERLILRPFRLGDVDDVLAYARDPEWSRYLRLLPRPYEREHAEQFVARQLLLDPTSHPAWAVTLTGSVIGGVNLRFAFEHRSVEIGYSIARSQWNRGIGTEAARAAVDAAFTTHLELNRLFARADVENVGSHRVLEKLGMTREGVLRKNRVERGEAIDEAYYSILRGEWEVLSPRHRRRRLADPPVSTPSPKPGGRRREQ
jgi:ribosomal-protein-alanine N-acetyltransferase